MTEVTFTSTTVDPELAALFDEWERESPQDPDPEVLAHLALVPTWTPQLADHCKLPRDGPWDEFLVAAEGAGFVQQVQPDADPDAERVSLQRFWMPEATRAGALQQAIEAEGRDYLADLAARLGRKISELEPDDPSVPEITRVWAVLARDLGQGMGQLESVMRQISKRTASRTADTSASAFTLSERVAALAGDGKIGTARVWIDAGKILASALGGSLEGAVALSQRRVELSYRQDIDDRYLARFIDRDEPLEAFHKLMTGPDDLWALHYLGMGGVGKTMLLRHIGRLAQEAYRSPVARVDFDYLRPDYPVRGPGHLLLALAADLRLHFSDSEHGLAYDALHDNVTYLHEVITGEPPKAEPLANLRREEFKDALVLFAELLKSLLKTADKARDASDPPARIVLVLDTCEELVASQFGASAMPHLTATFEILERIRRRIPAVRVIFAGRRLLTLGGEGWHAAAHRLPKAKSYLLPVKSYLRLHLVLGFDSHEAKRLFDKFEETSPRPLPPEIRDAILSVSADHGTPAALLADDGRPWLFPAPLYQRLRAVLDTPFAQGQLDALTTHERVGPALRSLPGADRAAAAIEVLSEMTEPNGDCLLVLLLAELADQDGSTVPSDLVTETEALLTRSSPFNLSIYSDWYADERDLTAAQIRDGGVDPYVELRIVRRITQEPVRRLLPAVVLLRRFNRDMLEPAFTGRLGDYTAVFRALSDYEWLEHFRDPETDRTWLEINPNFYPRLRDYIEEAEPAALAEARQLLRPKLVEAVRSPLSNLATEEITAALALLPDSEAVDLWSEVEWRVPVEADWFWGLRVTRMVLAAEANARPDPRPLVAAALRATQAAANIQLSATYDAYSAWHGVATTLEKLPEVDADTPLARWLNARAELGQITASRLRGLVPGLAGLDKLRTLLAERAEAEGPFASLAPHQIEQLDASLCAAQDAWLDSAEEAGARDLLGSAHDTNLRILSENALDPRQRSFAWLLEGRILAQLGDGDRGREVLVKAERLAADAVPDTSQRSRWADWRAPAQLRERIRLEWLRLRPDLPAAGTKLTPAQQLEGWLRDLASAEVMARIDGERLASAALARLLALQPAPAGMLASLEKAYRYDPERQPTCLAHRLTPPLFLALARAWLALGDPARSQKLLRAAQEAGTVSAADAHGVAAAQRGLIEVARRTRDVERSRVLLARQATLGWPDPHAWSLVALTGALMAGDIPAPAEDWHGARLHAWWRAQSALPPEQLMQAGWLLSLAAGESLPARYGGSAPQVPGAISSPRDQILLDLREFRLVAGEGESPSSYDSLLQQVTNTPRSEQRPSEAEGALRTMLRLIATDAFPIDAYRARSSNLSRDGMRDPSDLGPGLVEHDWLLPSRNRGGGYKLSDLIPGSVGVRRAAEIALDEGELLALRLPRLAAPVLRQAHDWFQAAGDPVGAFQSCVLWALVSIRANAFDDARAGLDACRLAYAQLAAARPGDQLPSWLALQNQVRAGDPAILGGTGNLSPGWVTRVAACILWAASTVTPLSERWPAALAQLENLELGPAPPELLPTDQADAGPEPEPDAGFWDSLWAPLAIGGCSLLVLAGILVGLYFGFRALLSLAAPSAASNAGISVGLFLGALVLLAVLIAGSRRLLRFIGALLASRAEIDVTVRATAASVTADTPVAELQLGYRQLKWRITPPFLVWGAATEQQEQIGMPINVPYATAVDLLGKSELLVRLADLAERAGRWGIVVRLAVSTELSGYPWESWLGTAAMHGKLPRVLVHPKGAFRLTKADHLRFVRVGLQAKPSPQPFTPGGLRVSVGKTWAGLFEAAWTSAMQLERLAISSSAHLLAPGEALRVLHVIGRPMPTTSGYRIQVTTDGYNPSGATSKIPSRAEGVLVGAGDLAQSALQLTGRLVILQAKPSADVWSREIARHEATILRSLATEVLTGGVPAVLVLPALPPDQIELVVRHLARALRREPRGRPDDLKPWLAAVKNIRKDVCAWRPSINETAGTKDLGESLLELAWDVSLWWRDSE